MDPHVIVLVDSGNNQSDPTVQQLLGQIRTIDATASVTPAEEMASLTAPKALAEPPAAVVLGPGVCEPVKIARKLRAAGLESFFVFAAEPSRVSEMRKQLFYAGPRGAQWALEAADSPNLTDVIQRGMAAVQRSRRLRLTLDHINERMSGAHAIDANRYRQLQVSDRYLASILEHAQDAILSLDRSGQIRSWNRGAVSLFGIAESDALGVSIASLLPELPMIGETMKKTASGEVVRRELAFASREQVKHLDAVFTPIHDEKDGIIGITAIIRDITQQKQASEALREADRRKDEFLAVLAHELRNPLAPLSNAIQLMKMPELGEAQRGWSRDVAERQVQHMAYLLDDLLDVSRISRGTLNLRKERVPLREAIDAAIETVRPMIDEKGHRLTVAWPEEEEVILDGDPVRLTQIFGNLLSNAAKYSPARGEIGLTARAEEDFVEVSVKDNGIGIGKEMLPRVFEMFTQMPSEGVESGIGVGLGITRSLVELHGGQIEARSGGEGCGSEFILRLRRCPGSQAPDESVVAEEDVQTESGRRILVVDDNVDSADSLAMTLEFSGCTARTAYNGADALHVVEEFRPDVVLLDIGMPEMDGYEVARRIRNMPQGKETLIIALTGWGQDEHRRRTAEAGFDEHVTKPVDHTRLMQLVRHDI